MNGLQLKELREKNNETQSSFAKKIGVSTRTLQNWESGTTNINKSHEKAILGLVEEPATIYGTINTKGSGAPFYDVDFIAGFDIVTNDQTTIPDGWINLPEYNNTVDAWVKCSGDSMSRLIDNGDILGLKRIENWTEFLLLNEIYGIVTEEFRTVKWLKKSEIKDHYTMQPENSAMDPQDIPISVIKQIYHVKAVIKVL